MLDLSAELHRQPLGVEQPEGMHPAPAGSQRLPECGRTQPDRADDAQAGYHHATRGHGLSSGRPTRVCQEATPLGLNSRGVLRRNSARVTCILVNSGCNTISMKMSSSKIRQSLTVFIRSREPASM